MGMLRQTGEGVPRYCAKVLSTNLTVCTMQETWARCSRLGSAPPKYHAQVSFTDLTVTTMQGTWV